MTKILLHRNNNAELTGVVLSSGEPAFALDLNVLKIGDGVNAWENLDPIGDSGSLSAAAVSSLNGLTGGISIVGGTDLEVTAAGSSITIDYTGVGGGLTDVVNDTTPQLGGDLDLNTSNITGVGNINIDGNITAVTGSLDTIDLTPIADTNYPPHSEGRLFYDQESRTITLYNDEANISLQIGHEQYIRVRNNTPDTITNGSVVRINGAHNGLAPTIVLASADTEDNSDVAGVATHDIESSSFGYITTFGFVRDVVTSGVAQGAEIFLSTTSGEFTDTAPTIPNFSTSIGHVISAHPSNGTILVFLGKHKLGGGDVKSINGYANLSGIPYIGALGDTNAMGLRSTPDFIYDSGNGNVYIGGNQVLVSGDNISQLVNDAGYLDAHPTISAASSSNGNTGNTFIQNITLDSNGHITALSTAVATSGGGGGGSGIQSLSEDPDPTLGGNLVTSTYFVSGNLIPYSNSTFDLGTAERKWRHLYLSNNSLKFVDESETTYALGVDVETGNLIYGADSGVLIKENDNVGLLDANQFYNYSLGSGTTGSFNPGASSKVNLVRVTTTGDLIIQGILPPTNSSSKLYNPFKLISNTSSEIRLKHNYGTTINRLYFDSATADGTEVILRQGESVDLIYLSGIVGTGPDSYRWYSTLNQNELNGDVVAGTGISLVYSTGTNELEISTNLYSVPDGITGASGVNNIVVMGSGDYDALTTKNPTTLYFIT
jgi:hypothetical protein